EPVADDGEALASNGHEYLAFHVGGGRSPPGARGGAAGSRPAVMSCPDQFWYLCASGASTGRRARRAGRGTGDSQVTAARRGCRVEEGALGMKTQLIEAATGRGESVDGSTRECS